MKKLLTLITVLSFTFSIQAQQYSIANWYNDFQACMVQTYDDMNSAHITECTPHLFARNMGGTIFLDLDPDIGHITLAGGWAGLMNAVDQGIEIANHTQNHLHFDPVFDVPDTLEFEINGLRDSVNNNVTNQDCNTFAYPYGEGNDHQEVVDVLKKHHIGARDAGFPGMATWGWGPDWIYDFGSDENDYYHIPTIAEHLFFQPVPFGKSLADEVNNLLLHGGLMTMMWHHKLDWDDHAKLLDEIIVLSDGKIWHSNFRDAILYHRERHSATLSTVSETSSQWTLALTDTLSDNTTFSHPLTIKLNKEGRTISSITQAGNSISYTDIESDNIQFNAVPDGGDIVIETLGGSNAVNSIPSIVGEIYPNPVVDVVTISVLTDEQVKIKVVNAMGVVVHRESFYGKVKRIDFSGLPSGMYTIESKTNNSNLALRKIIKM